MGGGSFDTKALGKNDNGFNGLPSFTINYKPIATVSGTATTGGGTGVLSQPVTVAGRSIPALWILLALVAVFILIR
jgi:hypothetical protein